MFFLGQYVYVQTDWATIFSFVCPWLMLLSSTCKLQETHWVDHNLPSRLFSFWPSFSSSGSSKGIDCCSVCFCLRPWALLFWGLSFFPHAGIQTSFLRQQLRSPFYITAKSVPNRYVCKPAVEVCVIRKKKKKKTLFLHDLKLIQSFYSSPFKHTLKCVLPFL